MVTMTKSHVANGMSISGTLNVNPQTFGVNAHHFGWRTHALAETAEVEQQCCGDGNIGNTTTHLRGSKLADILIDLVGLGDLHATPNA